MRKNICFKNITDYDDCGNSSQSHHADTHEFFISGTTAIIAKELW